MSKAKRKIRTIFEENQNIVNRCDEFVDKHIDDIEFFDNLDKKLPTVYFDINRLESSDDKDIVHFLMNEPKQVIVILTERLKSYYPYIKDVFPVIYGDSKALESSMKTIRQFGSDDIGKLVVFKGIVRKCTGIIPKLKVMALECSNCNRINEINQTSDIPDTDGGRCEDCKTNEVELRDDLSTFVDFIRCEIEESPDMLAGKQAEHITCEITGTLTNEKNRIGVGDRVTVIGIYRSRQKEKNSLEQVPYVEVLGTKKSGKNLEDFNFTSEDVEKFNVMSNDTNLLKNMARSVAPSIYGLDIEKMAMVLQMFGGNLYSERRGDIHILLIGDPSVGKSRMVRYTMEVAPLVVKASGPGTTGVGISACVNKNDDKYGGYVLEAGAAALANGGILIIDEFDKMKDDVKGVLHDIMEDQQTVIAKANINATLQTKCSILAIMNPKKNRFNDEETVFEQIGLSPSLLSRFDLIFAIRDVVDEKKDRKVVKSILNARQGIVDEVDYDIEVVTKYIMYAKLMIHEMTYSAEANQLLEDRFVEMRKLNSDGIAITNRQMEGMGRLSEACAKSRLSDVVEWQDAEVAINIMDYYLKTMCTDQNGSIDIDKVQGRETKAEYNIRSELLKYVKDNYLDLTEGRDNGYILSDVLKLWFTEEKKVSDKDYDKAFAELKTDGKLVERSNGKYVKLVQNNFF